MAIRCTITAANVVNEYGQALAIGTIYTPNNDDYALALISQGKATDTDDYLEERVNAPFDEVVYPLVPAGYATDASGNVTGLVGLGADIGDNVLLIGTDTRSSGDEKVAIEETNTNPDADNRPVLMRIDQAIDSAAAGTIDWHALDVRCYGGGANADFSANSGFYAAEGKTQFTGTAGQTMGKTVGVFGSSVMNGSSATLNLSIGVQGEIQNTGAGTTVNAAAFYAKTPIISAGAVTSAYGLFVQSVTGATANFAICTQAGRTWFHSTTAPPAGGSFKIGLLMSSTDTLGVYFGSGAPTVSAAQGSLYMRTDGSSTSTRLYVNTNGSTGWTNVTTAA